MTKWKKFVFLFTFSKQCIHFFLSFLCPPTSNIWKILSLKLNVYSIIPVVRTRVFNKSYYHFYFSIFLFLFYFYCYFYFYYFYYFFLLVFFYFFFSVFKVLQAFFLCFRLFFLFFFLFFAFNCLLFIFFIFWMQKNANLRTKKKQKTKTHALENVMCPTCDANTFHFFPIFFSILCFILTKMSTIPTFFTCVCVCVFRSLCLLFVLLCAFFFFMAEF